jgi:hypothetical protein
LKSKELRERLLVALYLVAKDDKTRRYFDAQHVAQVFGFEWRPGELRLVVDELEQRRYIATTKTIGSGADGGLNSHILQPGMEEAEELLEIHPEYGKRMVQDLAPATDRYVSLQDNQLTEADEDLRLISDLVRGDNGVSEEDRAIALSEIAAFEATLVQPRVPIELIDRFVKHVILWITRTFTAAAVGVAAKKLIELLLPLLPSSLS